MRRWLRRLGWVVAVLAGLLLLGGGLLWLERTEALAWAAARMLERQGLGPARFTVDRVDWQGLHAHDVTLAGGALKADELAFGFAPRELLAGHLASLEIGGLAAALGYGPDGLTLNGRPLSPASAGDPGGSASLGNLRIDALTLRDAALTLDTPGGRVEAVISARLTVAGGNIQASDIDAAITAALAGLPGPLKARISGALSVAGSDIRTSGLSAAFTIPLAGLPKPVEATLAGDVAMTGGAVQASALKVSLTVPLAGQPGPVKATITGALGFAQNNLQASGVSATVTTPIAGWRGPLTITLPRIAIQPGAAGGPKLSFEQASISTQDLPWTADTIAGEILFPAGKTTAKLSIGRLANRQKPMLVTALKLLVDAVLTGQRLDFTLVGDVLGKGPARLQAKGRLDFSTGAGNAAVTLGPLVFRRGGLQPADLSPALASVAVENVDGSIGLAGRLAWTARGLVPDLTLTLKDLAFALSGAELRQVNGAIKLARLWPPATPSGQKLTALVVAPGVPPAKLSLQGQLDAKPLLKLDRVAIEIAGGTISAANLAIDAGDPAIDTSLKVEQVDLAEITRLIGLDGLSGSGRLDGQIPLVLKGGKVAISAGHLAAREPGLLRYQPGNLPPEIAAAGESVQLALQALSDFHYDKLALDLDKAISGEGTVQLHLEGNNPAVLSGQLFNFNIRIESNFDRLADIALLSLRSAEELLRRAAGRTGP
jgi:hypothetical protein